MNHPFGDLLTQHLHRKRGLSQAKLAAGILQTPSIISEMCQGKRLHGPQARERVTAIITWLQQQGVLATLAEANTLLNAAGMSALHPAAATEASLLQKLAAPVVAPSLPGTEAASPRPPLRLTPTSNLPTALTPFIGRSAQIAHLVQLLQTQRLLTLTGAGGVGKTRLALEVGRAILDFRFGILDSSASQPANPKSKIPNLKFPDGVWFVDLAPLTDPNAIPQRILDLWRVPEQPDRSPLETLTAYLSGKQTLLLLDNCEHLISACAALAETLLHHCPQLVLLATSREALNIGGEVPWRVPSLTRPRSGYGWEGQPVAAQPAFTPEALAHFESVTLFVERAALRQPGFALTTTNAPAVAQICSRLDGIPLALEMAAARINVFTVEEIAKRLEGAFDERFQLLTSGARTAPLRHQTLRATLEWSYGLLTAKEQCLLVCLSVFSGGWTFAAAAEVTGCSLDRLAQLVNKSLVIADQQAGQTRYRLLETVRQFAHAQLVACGEQDEIRQRHAAFFLALAEAAEPRLFSSDQMLCVRQLETEIPNLRAALIWFQQMDIEDGLRLANALWYVWLIRDDLSEGRQWLEALLAKEVGTVVTKARATWRAASLAEAQGDLRQMAEWAAAAASLARAADDKLSLGNALILLGNVAVGVHEDSARAEVLYKEALHLFNEVEPEPGYWSALALEMLGDLTDVRQF